jgi:serine/threonine-protein kinase HipA
MDSAAVQRVLGEVCTAISTWATVARSAAVGMSGRDLEDFAPAFENEQMRIAKTLLR